MLKKGTNKRQMNQNKILLFVILVLTGCKSNHKRLSEEIAIQKYIAKNFDAYKLIYFDIYKEIKLKVANFNDAFSSQFFREYKIDNLT